MRDSLDFVDRRRIIETWLRRGAKQAAVPLSEDRLDRTGRLSTRLPEPFFLAPDLRISFAVMRGSGIRYSVSLRVYNL